MPPQVPSVSAGKTKSAIQPFKSIIIEKHTSTNKDMIKSSNQMTSNVNEQATTSKHMVSNKQQNEMLAKDYFKSKLETAKR